MNKGINLDLGLTQVSTTQNLKSGKIKSISSTNVNSKKKEKGKALEEYGTFIEIQPFDVPCLVMTDILEFLSLYGILSGKDGSEFSDAGGLCVIVDSAQFGMLHLMYLPDKYDELITWHECLHMAHFMMSYVGIDVDGERSSSEMQCYLQAHIVDLVKKMVYPKKKKATKKAARKKKQ